MNKRFFIYTLPRSGSAWLSNFFSHRNSFCFHEPLADGDYIHLMSNMSNRLEPVVGAIDTSAYQRPFKPEEFVCKKFVLHRPLCDIKQSLKLRGWVMDMDKEAERFYKVAGNLPAIYYTMLFNVDYLERLWELIVGDGFDKQRAQQLVEMNVQREFTAIKRRTDSEAYRKAWS